MRNLKFPWSVFLVFLMACLLVPQAWPQASTGTVSGTVRDQTGAVIPGASVTLTNTNTNIASKSTSNAVGFYIFPNLTPGPYRLAVEAAGMQKFEATLTLQVGQVASVDVAMKIGQTVTEVTVQDVTPMLQTTAPTLGHVLERTRIEQLPINGRAVTNLLQTVPGMEGTRAFGLRNFAFEISLDGAVLADRYGWNTMSMRQPGLDSIQEFVVETNNSSAKFTRPTNIVMTTKSGTNQLHGTAFETNRNNGYGLARRRQDTWGAPGTKAPFLNRNEFGATAGGPVYIPKLYNGKDRTFWFVSWEALRQIQQSTGQFQLPTAEMRNGDMRNLIDGNGNLYKLYNPWTTDPNTWARQQFSYNGQLNVIDPKLFNPLAKFLLDDTPLPNTPDNPFVTNNWRGPIPSFQRSWTISARMDHRFSDKDVFFGRYTKGDFRSRSQFYGIPSKDYNKIPANTYGYTAPNQHLALSYTHTFSPTFFNELLVSGTRELMFNGTGELDRKYATELGLPNPFNVWGWPGLYSAGFGLIWETQNANAFNAFYMVVDDNATKILGRHELQFGYHFRWDQMNLMPQQQQVAGNINWGTGATSLYDPNTSRTNPQATAYTGHNFGNFWIGVANYSNQFVRGMYYARGKEHALYFQDNFRATPRLTLNMGVRWDYWPVFTEKHNVVTSFDPSDKKVILGETLERLYTLGMVLPTIVNTLQNMGMQFKTWDQTDLPQNLMSSPLTNIGPRLGFAYRAGDGLKSFVIRGGYRISYFHLPLGPWAARMRMNAPMNARFYRSFSQASYSPDGIGMYGMRSVPTVLAGVNSADAVPLDASKSLTPGCCGVSYFARNQPDPRVQDWNLTFEKEVMENTVARAGYVGWHAARYEQLYQFNNATPEYVWYMTTKQRLPTGPLAGVARNYFDQKVYGTLERWQNTGWGNSHGFQIELERRYSKGYGYQVFYVMNNVIAAGGAGYSGTSVIPEVNQYLPGQIPADMDERNRLLNYQRDTSVPKHRVRWNWIVDLPFGKGKPLGSGAGPWLDRLIGGWQIAGIGSYQSRYFSLNAAQFPTGAPIEIYGKKYPIQNCTSGVCYPAYLYWNGYIPAHQINSVDPVTGKPNGYMGIPSNYKPAMQPLWPYPANYRSLNSTIDPLYAYYGGNTVWVPLADGSVQRTTWTGLQPLRQQYVMGVGQWGVDASLFKTIPVNERFRFRFNADFFNVLNRPGTPNVGSNGIIEMRNSDLGARTLQLTLRVEF